jgi:pimeloyl-ACP methyl ester carboxylesterase
MNDAPGTLVSARDGAIHVHRGGNGPPLVLVNGWSASGLIWGSRWLTALERHHDVVRVDNRGTGWSPASAAEFTLDDLCADVLDVCDALELQRPALLGMSMGGMIAQRLAVMDPQRWAALVLVATGPPIPALVPAPEGVLGSMMGRPKGLSAKQMLSQMWGGIAAPGFAERDPGAVDELVSSALAAPTRLAVIAQQWGAIKGFRNPEMLDEIVAPTLIIHGINDPLLVVENGRRLASSIRAATLVERPDVGHLVPYEDPESAELITRFLADVV